MKKQHFLFISCFTFFLIKTFFVYGQKPDNPEIWKNEIRTFEKTDEKLMPEKGVIVFVGSSSIRAWNSLEEDFPGHQVLNRGFGGSRISDATYYFQRILTKHQPSQIVMYSGENDIASGKSAEMTFERFKSFYKKVKKDLPSTELVFISIKPSLARWEYYPEIDKANRKIKRFSFWHNNLRYVDVSKAMLGENGEPKPEIFKEDGLHMNSKGYKIWREIISPYLIEQP